MSMDIWRGLVRRWSIRRLRRKFGKHIADLVKQERRH